MSSQNQSVAMETGVNRKYYLDKWQNRKETAFIMEDHLSGFFSTTYVTAVIMQYVQVHLKISIQLLTPPYHLLVFFSITAHHVTFYSINDAGVQIHTVTVSVPDLSFLHVMCNDSSINNNISQV